MRFFFYGTLLDADLRRAVCGTAADGWASVPAALADHRRGRSAGLAYPFLLPAPGESVEGLVVDGIDAEAAALLTLYEGEGYRCERCRPGTAAGPVDAWIFVPARAVSAPLPWSLADWRRRHKAAALAEIGAWRATLGAAAGAQAELAWRAREAAG